MSGKSSVLGSIEDVEGASASVQLNDDKNFGLSFVEGYGYRVGQIGSFVRIPIGYDDIFGIVSQVGARAAPQTEDEAPIEGSKWIKVQFIGEASQGETLSPGLSRYPTVGDDVHLVTKNELPRIYGVKENTSNIQVGSIVGAERIPAQIDLNKLVTRHSAVVGSTGAGKSTTVAGLLWQLVRNEEIKCPRILVFDIHGEYGEALKEVANVYSVDPGTESEKSNLFIPYWALSFDSLAKVAFGSFNRDRDRGGVIQHILRKKRKSVSQHGVSNLDKDEVTVDTPIPFSIHKLWYDLHRLVKSPHTESRDQSLQTVAYAKDEEGNIIDKGDPLAVKPPETQAHDHHDDVFIAKPEMNIGRQVDTLAYRLRDPRYDFLFKPGDWLPSKNGTVERDLDELLEGWLGHESGITVLDLSGIPNDILDTLVGSLLKIVYDSIFWAREMPEGGRSRPLLTVLEEAHSYLNDSSSGSAAKSVQRVVKEGRKYGIGSMLVSQRPTEIDKTILSQCGTILSMRLSNSEDRSSIKSSVSDNLQSVLKSLPILRTGEAIIVGQAVKFPIRAHIEPPPEEYRPESQDPLVMSPEEDMGWNRELAEQNYDLVLESWRGKNPKNNNEPKDK